MQAVTCFQCGRDVIVAPNHYVCSHCGADLQHLLLPETVATYFQARAHESSERGELGAALAEAERGLTYADSSELHLLAAILAKQLGRHDSMRQHVAAIPVDDSLRSEAEWLLRSHQDRERALQEATRQSSPPRTPRTLPKPATPSPAMPSRSMPSTSMSKAEPAHTFLEELLGGESAAPHERTRTFGQRVASILIVVAAVTLVAASWWWIGPGTLPTRQQVDAALPTSEADAAVASQREAIPFSQIPTATVAPIAAPVVIAATPTMALLPTATASPVPTSNLVQAAIVTPVLADADPSRVVMVETTVFDIRQYLRDLGRAELAELGIDARLQGATLLLQGFVHLDAQRQQLLAIARDIPGVNEVNAVNLLLRPLPTYIVQPGDTLWSIVFTIYGDVDRLDEFAAYNRDVLPSPDALAPGMELRVLPVQ